MGKGVQGGGGGGGKGRSGEVHVYKALVLAPLLLFFYSTQLFFFFFFYTVFSFQFLCHFLCRF